MLGSIIIILSYDIWFYISHIILHTNKFYYIHKYHHSIKYDDINYTDTYKSDNIEIVLQGISVLFPYIYINFDIYSFLFAITFINIRGLMRHDKRFVWLVGDHHLLHHKYHNYNYGEPWIDYLCSTLYSSIE